MADYCFGPGGARFIVLHYDCDGSLTGVKLCRTMRGARGSKRYHEGYAFAGASKIVDVELLKHLAGEGVLPMSAADAEMLCRMGIAF